MLGFLGLIFTWYRFTFYIFSTLTETNYAIGGFHGIGYLFSKLMIPPCFKFINESKTSLYSRFSSAVAGFLVVLTATVDLGCRGFLVTGFLRTCHRDLSLALLFEAWGLQRGEHAWELARDLWRPSRVRLTLFILDRSCCISLSYFSHCFSLVTSSCSFLQSSSLLHRISWSFLMLRFFMHL